MTPEDAKERYDDAIKIWNDWCDAINLTIERADSDGGPSVVLDGYGREEVVVTNFLQSLKHERRNTLEQARKEAEESQ